MFKLTRNYGSMNYAELNPAQASTEIKDSPQLTVLPRPNAHEDSGGAADAPRHGNNTFHTEGA